MTKVTMPEPIEIDWPELHSQALGCGVEDRGIHDRYEAAEYGWQDGVDKAIERVPEQIFDAAQMEAYAAAKVREALEEAARRCVESPMMNTDVYCCGTARLCADRILASIPHNDNEQGE